jgi:signal transduction histidine kinase
LDRRVTGLKTWGVALATAYVVISALEQPRNHVWSAPRANLVIQTTAALVAVLVAVIAFGRFRQRRESADLMLVLGLAQLGAANLLFTALPLAGTASAPHSRTIWAGVVVRLVGTVLIAGAAHAPYRVVERPGRGPSDGAAVVAATGVLVLVTYLIAGRLPALDARVLDPAARMWSVAPRLAWLNILAAAASAIAAIGFVRARARRRDDELLSWLAVACVLAAGSNAVTAGSFLSTFSAYVSVSEILKLACYLVLLGGVGRQIIEYWHDRAAVAIAEERRRIAHDLHDGLAQELAFVVTRSRMIARRTGDEEMWSVCSAAERALDESRRAIAALSRDGDEALDVALAQTAEEVAGRLGTAVTLELDQTVAVPNATKEALLRIAREAITNAARHGAATRIHVRLSGGDGVRLRISDNGKGFDATRTQDLPGRLGVTGMRERTAALGGELLISSRRPGGTDVEVVLP